MARSRPQLPRHRAPWWLRIPTDPISLRRTALVALAALVPAVTVARVVDGAERTRAAWGATTPVLITTRPVTAGQHLAGRVARVRWPAGLVPAGAARSLAPGARAAQPLSTGAPITAVALRDPAGGHDRTTPPGRALVAVPRGPDPLPVHPGDRVEVWATDDPALSSGRRRPRTHRVARDAVVAAVTGRTAVLAVTDADVPRVADAVALATVSVVAIGR